MKKLFTLLLFTIQFSLLTSEAQLRRPVDSQHPMWMIHVDVWNNADPQKIIDLIPADIKPYVCMNLSLSCRYNTELNMYHMPRNAVRTYKSWASVCQLNNMWFTCQPASGGKTHIQDDDLETFEYFFKNYPNFLGWNYAEQFWGFDEPGDKCSSSQTSRLALFAKLVPMHHQYGGFLTISFCGNIWSHGLNPIGMMKRNKDLLKACKDYPEAILWLYKYTTSSCFYNNESVTWGPFISGLAKNYGVRYDNCGWNGATSDIIGEDKCVYPAAAGIGTVMEQTAMNGGAVWDGPELIWTEDFQELSATTVDGYRCRKWGTIPNFDGVWVDMFRQIVKGNMYIPTREEVVNKTKVVVVNDVTSGGDEDKYAAWGDLYDGLYKQTDPFNRGNGQWMDNYCYFKKTGRYGAIPIVIGLYDDAAKKIPVQVKKSQRSSRWGTQTKKVADFNAQYPVVSTGDLFVERYKNQLVTYTPYTYLNKNKRAAAVIPLQYNTCKSLELKYDKLSSGLVREYADSITFYLNNYRRGTYTRDGKTYNDTTTLRTDTLIVNGFIEKPTYVMTKHATAKGTTSATEKYDAEAGVYKLTVKHCGAVNIRINCSGNEVRNNEETAMQPVALPIPKQPEPFVGPVVIEAENMDNKSISGISQTHYGWCDPDVSDFTAMGYVKLGTSTSAALRHQLTLQQEGDYNIYIRYCKSSKAGNITVTVNGTKQTVSIEKTAVSKWLKAKVSAKLNAGKNTFILTNTGGIDMLIDQIVYEPVTTPVEKYQVTVREVEHGKIVPSVSEAAAGEIVTFTAVPDAGYGLKELQVVNSVFYTMGLKVPLSADGNGGQMVMPEDNIAVKAVFVDMTSVNSLDFSNVLAGALPVGWRTTDGTSVRNYPTSNSSGPRTMTGFTGYQGKALYWRNTSAELGRLTGYPLKLEVGKYKLTWAMAAWSGSPKYNVNVIDPSGKVVASMTNLTAAPDAVKSSAANLSSAKLYELEFETTQKGNYVVQFQSTGGGYTEYLLVDCRVNIVIPTDIHEVSPTASLPAGIYSVAGVRRESLQKGLNIVVSANGESRKVYVR
jgi:hypothetical protein